MFSYRGAGAVFRALLLPGLLAAAGCDGPTDSAPRAAELRLSADSLAVVQGTADTLTALVVDSRGNPVPAARVAWASSDTAVATVDSAGVVRGVRVGTAEVSATTPGQGGTPLTVRSAVRVLPSVRLTFEPDSIVLGAPGCSAQLLARVRRHSGEELTALSPPFSVADSTVVSLFGLTIPGTYRGQTRGVHAERAGATQVIATYQGAADTARVRVVSDAVHRFYIGSRRDAGSPLERRDMAPGDTTRVSATAEYGPCAPGSPSGPTVPGVVAGYRSLDEGVATVDASGRVAARSRGTARIVGTWREFADTVLVEVRSFRVVPADTTVAVGDTVRYRAWATDAGGTETEVRVGGIGNSNGLASTAFLPGNVPIAVARGPGVVTIGLYVLGGYREATLRIVEKPGG
ncbi:MAG: Ig-like domain-containing protein [Gemmatimonadota bacterium]